MALDVELKPEAMMLTVEGRICSELELERKELVRKILRARDMENEVESQEKSKVDPELEPKKKKFMEKGKTREVNITRLPKASF